MRFLALFALVAAVAATKVSYNNYKVFRIIPTTEEKLNLLQQLDNGYSGGPYSYWQEPTTLDDDVDIMVAPDYLGDFETLMNVTNMRYETYVEDVQKLIDAEHHRIVRRSGRFGWRRYHDLEEIYEWLDSLEAKYPDYVEVITTEEQSYEGRDIKGVKLSYGRNNSAVFIEGGIHAREWISPATVTYLINQFLTSRNPAVRKLAESYDWYIFPSVNPDGYVYSHTTDRLWRKTRSSSKFHFCKGADANRNWDFKWNQINDDSYKMPCSETYSGSKPFSEVETRTLAKFIKTVSSKLFAYIAFHSYSQKLLFPYGHTTEHRENYDELMDMGTASIQALFRRYNTLYRVGSIAEVIYPAVGNSMDYVKRKYKLPIVYAYELRDKGKEGFILPPRQIIPNGEEVLDSLVALFDAARRLGYPERK